MLYIIHILFAIIVGCLLLTPVVLPFWKVWSRLKSHHPAIWQSRGPFDPVTMMAHPYVVSNFLEIIALAEHDETLKAHDPILVKWTHVAREMLRMLPRSLIGQTLAVLLFFILSYSLSGEIVHLFRG